MREGAWVGDVSNGVAQRAADGCDARWQLQRGPAVRAVDEHVAVHGCQRLLGGLVNWAKA